MKSYLRISSPWSQLALFFVLMGAGIIFTSFLSALVLVFKGFTLTGVRNLDLSDPRMSLVVKWMQGISSICFFLLPAILYALITFRRRPLLFLGFRRAEKTFIYPVAILLLLVAVPLVSWLGEINQLIPLPASLIDLEKEAARQLEAFLKAKSGWDVTLNLLIMALLPAVCEEACFRGSLQRILIHIFRSPWAGIVVTAIFFSAFHMQFQGFLPRMFLGLLLGALFWYGSSLWPNIIAHFFYNGIQVVLVIYYPRWINNNPEIPWLAALASGLAVWGLLYLIRKKSAVTYARIYDFEKVNEHNEFLAS